MKKYFFDITSTYAQLKKSKSFSGIQRVVATITAEAAKLLGPENVYLIIHKGSGFGAIPVSDLDINAISDPLALKFILHSKSNKIDHYRDQFPKYRKNNLKLAYHVIRKNIRSLLQQESEPRLKIDYNNTSTKCKKSAAAQIRKINLLDILEDGDVIFSLDASWSTAASSAFINLKKLKNVKIFTMVHDLIPLIMPFSVAPGIQTPFLRWLERSSEFSDVYIANSINTSNDLINYLNIKGANPKPIETVPLAQSLPMTSTESDEIRIDSNIALNYPKFLQSLNIRDDIRFAMSGDYVLCVGTLEIRKNIYRLARAWKILSESYPSIPRLIFAGKRGWGIDCFDDLMKGTGNISGLVTVIDSPSDHELQLLYKNCTIFAYPSIYEGWGLPVGEGLSYGKTGIVGNNSSLPEVGEDLVEYCDATSVESIVSAFEKLLFTPGLRGEKEAKIAEKKLRNWTDVAQNIIEVANKH